jgi:hypothetical protein
MGKGNFYMATLVEAFATLFPGANRLRPFDAAPLLPADVFAFTAHVLERSGGYHHVAPEVSAGSGALRSLRVSDRIRMMAVRAGLR